MRLSTPSRYIAPMSKPDKKSKSPTLAAKADKYKLYLKSVQEPGFEIDFFTRVFREHFKRKPLILREDFCGTAAVCAEWVKSNPQRTAVGVDLDPEPLAWGMKHILAKLKPAQLHRVELVKADVRDPHKTKADILAAQNFSFYLFTTRDALRAYFAAAHSHLKREGMMVLDMFGGSECHEEKYSDKIKKKHFTYIWEHARFDPTTHLATFHIHFKFPDGSKLKNAFSYDWRMWSIPEVRELLLEAGFKAVHVYWEGTDKKTGEGDNDFRIRKHIEPDPAWITYIVAVR